MFYVAYGSNLHPMRISERLGAVRHVATATLPGHRLTFAKHGRDGSGKCTLATGEGLVHVAVYDLDGAQFERLDRIEGPGYRRVTLDVPDLGPGATYVARAAHTDSRLRPFDWYRDLVVAGAAWQGFPGEYIAALRAASAGVDPDAARAARMRKLLAGLSATNG